MISCGSEMSAGVFSIHDVGGRVAEHPLGADVEDLDHARGVSRDAREVRAVEDRALEGARAQQRRDVPHLRTRDDRIGLPAPQDRHLNHRGEMLDRGRTARWSRSARARVARRRRKDCRPIGHGVARACDARCAPHSCVRWTEKQRRPRTNVVKSGATCRAKAGPPSLICGPTDRLASLRGVHQRSTRCAGSSRHPDIGASGDAQCEACHDLGVR